MYITTYEILAKLLITLYPNCLHATCPSAAPNLSKHITPHSLLWSISRRPMLGASPPTSRSDLSWNVEFTSQADLLPTLVRRIPS